MSVHAYKVEQNPTDRLWYVMGYCGKRGKRSLYMPVSDGFSTMGPARDALRRYVGSEACAKAELRGGSLEVHA